MTSERKKRSDGLETMDRLIEFAEIELNEVGPVRFNLISVLEKAGVSRSSAYHHFGDREGVIAAVETKHHIQSMRQTNEILRATVETSTDPAAILKSIKFHFGNEGGSVGRHGRQRRVYTLAASQSSPLLRQRLRDEQCSVADYLAQTIEIARKKGFIKPELSDLAIAHVMLSLLFGRVLVDLADRDGDDDEWLGGTIAVMENLLRVQGG